MYQDIPEELKILIEPVVEDRGLELVDAEVVRGRGPWQVRVTVDTPAGDGSVSVDRCAEVSREIGSQLEASDAISHAYLLEVSSPGLDRHLGREKDFNAACGEEVRIETRRRVDGRRRFRGRLERFDGQYLHVTVDGREFEIAFADVAKANVIYPFSRADFARAER